MEEVSDDKSLPKMERKRLQVSAWQNITVGHHGRDRELSRYTFTLRLSMHRARLHEPSWSHSETRFTISVT